MQPIKNLIVYGKKTIDPADGNVVYELETNNRGADNKQKIPIDDLNNQMEFTFTDGTKWICDAATLHEVYPEADPVLKPSGQRGVANDSFELPAISYEPTAERGIVGKIVAKAIKIFTKKAIGAGIGEIAKRLEDKHLKNGIPENDPLWSGGFKEKFIGEGAALFRIDMEFRFSKFNGAKSDKPFFLFIHGTNSDTLGAFDDLSKAALWPTLHNTYGENVIAFQHRTLTESPLENAVKLATMLPDNCTLHVISHSRGGIVGDILNMYSSRDGSFPVGFTNENIELLKKEKGRERDIKNIEALNRIFKTKRISITKFIRVACPAAGTKLASKRLDHVLNVFFNLFGGEANPYVDVLKELLSAAVSTKDNVDVLPGIEAQSPASPFIKILNDQSEATAIDGSPLAVISGNGTISISGSGLLVILGRLFYWQRNDLVVNTDSMYLGAKRKNNIQYFFAQGTEVNHIKYFANTATRKIIKNFLETQEGDLIPGFKSISQNVIPASDRDDRGLEHGELFPSKTPPSGNRPIAILLPGIMGSNLAKKGKNKNIWLNYLSMIVGGLESLNYSKSNGISAPSVVKTSYSRLNSRLSATYDVVIYPFDWRMPLDECAKDFNKTIDTLLKLNQPIKIVAHSMGGMLVRDFILNYDDTWQKLNSSQGFRLLFLGAPLGGSFRIPAVLFGQDAIINTLNMVDRKHSKKELLEMFVGFPGILNLLPLTTDKENDFSDPETWNKMRNVMGDPTWPVPDPDDLEIFGRYRDRIIEKRKHINYSNMVYIAGHDKQTPCGYFKDEIPPRIELSFLYTNEGDQSVTWESGIPEEIEKARNVYYVPVTHGALANAPDIFEGIEEILATGTTTLLKKTRPLTRGEEKLFRAPASFSFDLSQRGLENAVFGVGESKEPLASRVPVSVTVSNGDLIYSAYPVLCGHFINDEILYAEKVVDDSLNKMLSQKNELGLYPGEVGSNAIFIDPDNPNFPGAIIVGIGEPENLTSHELAKTTAQGVLNYLLSLKIDKENTKSVGISALMIGCGYGGLTIESSLKAIIEGVNTANEKITTLLRNKCKTIEYIEFVELYNYRALSCMYALNNIVKSENSFFNIVIGRREIKNLLGIRKRIPLDDSKDWWNRITVKHKPANLLTGEPSSMIFGASTSDAREQVNELYSSTPLIDIFIAEVSISNRWSARTAKTLFELMIPNDLKDKLRRKGNISWVLDINSASYPWELLQDSTNNAKPLCINSGMIRTLATSEYRVNVKRVARAGALIVGDPVLNGFINQLPGAKNESIAVDEIMTTAGYPVNTLINKNAADIVREFFSAEYAIVHLAGHGVFDTNSPNKSGMVIGKNVFLTVFDIQQMPVVPELVFVNCCHLGNVQANREEFYQNRYKLAANIGTELIRMGVKAVIAAGWAVDDQAARDFAQKFYSSMFAGKTFGEAVKDARNLIYERYPENNTWGAYQCYGDPFFKLKIPLKSKNSWSPSYIVPEEAEIHLDNLYNQIQMGKKTVEETLVELNLISTAIERDLVKSSAPLVQRQAVIYLEMAMYKEAIDGFKKLLNFQIADFSFSCMEKYCNARSKLYVKECFKADLNPSERAKLLRAAGPQLERAIKDLKVLCEAGETVERLNLMGSIYKRKAMLVADKAKRAESFKIAASYYEIAAENKNNSNRFYSLTNAIEIGRVLKLSGTVKEGGQYSVSNRTYKVRTIGNAKKQLEALLPEREESKVQSNTQPKKEDMDYWDLVKEVNINLCMLLLLPQRGSTEKWDELVTGFRVVWQKAGSLGKKVSEAEQIAFLSFGFLSTKNSYESVLNRLSIKMAKDEDEFANRIGLLRTAYNEALVNSENKRSTQKKAAARRKSGSKGK